MRPDTKSLPPAARPCYDRVKIARGPYPRGKHVSAAKCPVCGDETTAACSGCGLCCTLSVRGRLRWVIRNLYLVLER